MKFRIAMAFAFALSPILMAACDRTPETPKVESSSAGSPPASSNSVAQPQSPAPQSDASVPPTSGASAPNSATNSGDANSATQANPTQLQESQEQAAMPMSGQVNNHSVPETTGSQQK